MKSRIKFCRKCRDYTLKDICPRCGEKTFNTIPPRFSPEDPYGEYRRRFRKLWKK
ncbi:MAG: RNA-protein complex protein Nop10 [Archaeoglobi archaeon]|nr:RNA-protein complex protein Nop10 [Candidatus Mnemosynella bozhongmuii]